MAIPGIMPDKNPKTAPTSGDAPTLVAIATPVARPTNIPPTIRPSPSPMSLEAR